MLRNILHILGNRFVVRLANLALAIALARVLGPADQGVVNFLIMLSGLLFTFAILGFDAGAIYFPRRESMPSAEYQRRVFPILLASCILVCVGLLFCGAAGVPGIAQYGLPLLGMVGGLVACDAYVNVIKQQCLVRDDVSAFNRVERIQAFGMLLLVGIALILEPTPGGVLFAVLLSRLFLVAYATRQAEVRLMAFRLAGTRRILEYTLKPWLGNLFSLMNLRLDSLMISWFIGLSLGVEAADLGLYTICVLAVSRVQDLQAAILTALFPAVAGLEQKEGARLSARTYRLSGPVFLLLALALVVFGYPTLWIFGPEYTAAYPVLCVLAIGSVAVRANMGSLAVYLSSIGQPGIPTLVNLFGVLSNLFLNYLWIPRYGILGAALATACSAALVKGILLVCYLHVTRLSWWHDLRIQGDDLRDLLARFRRWRSKETVA